MTAEVEQRIVEMRFDNEQFEKGAKQTLSTLEKLDGVLDMLGAGGAMDKLSSALEAMQYRFSSFGIAGAAAIEKVTGKVIGLASSLLTAIPEQIMSGGTQRALNIENAKFQLKGLGVAWEEIADDIDHAVMGTAYGVDEAAKAAAILAASKVDFRNAAGEVSDMGTVLRSVSGLAAMTNSSYEDIGNLMGDIFAMGKLATRQLQSFELRGLNVAAKLSEVLRNSNGDIQYTEEQIRDMVSKGKIDALTFAKAMDAAFGEHATAANETYTGSLRNMKAALSRIGADFVAPVHEGQRKAMLALRAAFDRVRQITKPFAEGKFTRIVETLTDKFVKLADSLEFKGLRYLVNMLDKLDFSSLSRLLQGNPNFSSYDKLRVKLRGIWNVLVRIGSVVKDFGLSTTGKTLKSVADIVSGRLLKALDKLSGLAGRFEDSRFRRFLFDEIGPRLTKIGTMFRSLGSTAWTAGEVVAAIFQRMFSLLRDNGVFGAMDSGFFKLTEWITKASNKLREWLEKLRDFLNEHQSGVNALELLRSGFERVSSFIGNAEEKLESFLRKLIGLQEGQTVGERFRELLDGASGPLRSFGEALQTTFNSDDSLGTKIVKIFGAIVAGFLAFRKFQKVQWAVQRLGRVFDLLKGQWDGLSTLANLPDRISTVFSRLSGSLRALTDNLNAKSLVEIGKALLYMAIGIGILSLVDTKKAVTALEAMMVSLLALMTALGFMTKFLKVTMGLGVVAPVLLALAVSLLAIALAVGLFSLIPTEKLVNSVIAMGAVLLILVVALNKLNEVMTLANPIKLLAAAAAIVLIAGALVILAGAMFLFSLIPAKKMLAAWAAMSTALMSVVMAVGMLSKLVNPGAMLAGAAAIFVVGAALILIGVAAHLFKGIKMDSLLPMAVALVAVALAIGMLANFVNPLGMLAAAAALIVVSGALVILAIGLGMLSFVISQDENAIIHLAGLLSVLVIALAALSFVAPMALVAALALAVAGAALVIGAVGLLALAVALTLFNSVKVNPDYLMSFGGALVALGIAGVIFGIGGAGLMLGGAGLLVLAIALNLMSGVHVDPDYLMSFGGALVALGIAGVIFGIGGAGLMLGGIGLILLAKGLHAMEGIGYETLNPDYLLALGGGLSVLGAAGVALLAGATGLAVGGEALTEFSACLAPLAEGVRAFDGVDFGDIGALFGSLAAAIPALIGLNFAGFSNVGALKDFGEALIPLATGVRAFGDVAFWDLAKLFGGLATAIGALLRTNFAKTEQFSMLASGLGVLADSIDRLPQDADGQLKRFADAIRDNQAEAAQALGELLDGLAGAVTEHGPQTEKALHELAQKLQTVMNDSTYQQNWNTVGGNISVGIANGIIGRTGEAVNAMRRLASALQTSFTVSLAIHSPSGVFEALAVYVPLGVARGIQNGEPAITAAMSESMGGAMSVLDQYAKQAGDFTPSVMPVMNVEGMKREMAYADQLFGQSRLGNFSGLNGLTVHGDAISYNMQNRDVVTELKQLSGRVVQLGQAIEKMQIVMDSGVLVGQLAPGMNRELGSMAVLEGRQ